MVIEPLAGEETLEQLIDIWCMAFNHEAAKFRDYVRHAGQENVRVCRRDGELAGGLAILPMGQWYGGRCLRMGGISVVAVAPQHRSGGTASRMMRFALEELRAADVPLSVLYPATQPVYRRAGYELAGHHLKISLPTRTIDVRDRELPIRAATPDDEAAIRDANQQRVRRNPGNIERNDFMWHRVHHPLGKDTRGYVVGRDERIEGYVFLRQETTVPHSYDLLVSDITALTASAGRRLLSFFADHRSMARTVTWYGGPADPLLTLLAEQHFSFQSDYQWMLRLVHVPAALSERGYPAGLQAELHLDVCDDVLPENNGPCVLRVADGVGTVEPGGQGRFQADVRGLAALYAGYATPTDLQVTGQLQTDDASAEQAAAIFAGPAPWMTDSF
jgi:predicted acetyltransferase